MRMTRLYKAAVVTLLCSMVAGKAVVSAKANKIVEDKDWQNTSKVEELQGKPANGMLTGIDTGKGACAHVEGGGFEGYNEERFALLREGKVMKAAFADSGGWYYIMYAKDSKEYWMFRTREGTVRQQRLIGKYNKEGAFNYSLDTLTVANVYPTWHVKEMFAVQPAREEEKMYYNNVFDTLNEEVTDSKGIKGAEERKEFNRIEGAFRMIGDTVDLDLDNFIKDKKTKKEKRIFYTKRVKNENAKLGLYIKSEQGVISYEFRDENNDAVDATPVIQFLTEHQVSEKDKDVFKVAYTIGNAVKSVSDDINKVKQEMKEDSQADVLKEDAKEWTKKTAYQRFAAVIRLYVIKGQKEVDKFLEKSEDGDMFKLSKLNTFTQDSAQGAKLTLTEEEKLRLQAYMLLCSKYAATSSIKEIKGAEYSNGKRGIDDVNPNGIDTNRAKEKAEKAIKAVRGSTLLGTSTVSVSTNFNEVAMYMLAKVYGFEEDKSIVEPGETTRDADKITASEYLSKVTADSDYVVGKVIDMSYDLPYTKNLKQVAKGNGFKAYLDLQYNYMMIATYASQDAGVEKDKKTKVYINRELEEFISKNKKSKKTVSIPEELKSVILAYVEIKEGLDYLGVEPYTKELKAICEYYSVIVQFKDNKELKEYQVSQMLGEPLRAFFYVKERMLSKEYNIGVALSSTYVPMKTNVYDINSVACVQDSKFISEFHYPYGFNRKALYIDTNVNAAVDQYVTGKRGSTRVARLEDLLNPEKDIVLYVDDNFYNIKGLAEMQGKSYNKMANTDEAGKDKSNQMADVWSEWMDTSIESIAKTGPKTKYSDNIKNNVVKYGEKKKVLDGKGKDKYVLTKEVIDKYLDKSSFDEYSPLQGFAVVSALYRHSGSYDIVSKQTSKPSPVFVSSANLAGVQGVGQEQFNSIFNYLMLKNIKGNMGIDYKTTLDLDSPLYIDIYGNILTESGLVVIPSAANPTLCKEDKYSIYSAGFLSLYNNGFKLESSYNNSDTFMKKWFYKDKDTEMWEVQNKSIGTAKSQLYMNFKDLPVSDERVLKTFQELEIQQINNDAIDFNKRVYLITEVLRGAPSNNIDKEFEGLKGVGDPSKYGMFLASKLEELCNQMLSSSNGNSVLALPNLAFMENIEYVVLFVFKLIFAVMIIGLFYRIYMDAVDRVLGFATVWKFAITILVFFMIAYTIPTLLDVSYYQANKQLLQQETESIALLNLEKRSEGKEIGVYSVSAPETSTELYLKMEDLEVPWYKLIGEVLTANAFDSVSEMYDESFDSSLMARLPGITRKSNGLYMDVTHLFETSTVEYLPDQNAIVQRVTEEPYASYVIPYYVILDHLIANVDNYNVSNNIKSYTTKVQSKGAVKTVGIAQAYLTSIEFMENSQDVLGLKNIYGVDTSLAADTVFSEEDIKKMGRSKWYSKENYKEDKELLENRLNKIDDEAREFVLRNKMLLGKVTDETFLKVMALEMSMKHNDIFNVPAASAVEVFELDTKDILRMSVVDRQVVMNDSAKSFARFIYDNCGSLGVLTMACLIVVYFVSSIVKPLVVIVIIACAVTSLLIRQVIKQEKNQALEGFIITMALLCGINILFALVMKTSMLIPRMGVTPVIAILIQIAIQIAYLVIMSKLVTWVIKDWKSFGYNRYAGKAKQMSDVTVGQFELILAKAFKKTGYKDYTGNARNKRLQGGHSTAGVTGRTTYKTMQARDLKRGREHERWDR